MSKHKSKLEARVAAVNKANAYAPKLHAMLTEALTPFVGQKILKVGGLVQKAKQAIDALNLPYGSGLNVTRNSNNYSISFNIQACETFNDCAYYYDTAVYVGELNNNDLAKLTPINGTYKSDYTEAEVLAKREAFKAAEKEYDKAKSALGPFGEYDR